MMWNPEVETLPRERMEALQLEVAPFGVTVNSVMPGYTRTQRVDDLALRNASLRGTTPCDERAVWEKQIPFVKIGRGRRLLFDRTDLDRYIEQQKQQAA